MSQAEQRKTYYLRVQSGLAATLGAALCLGLLLASQAAANFEQVTTFSGTPGVLKNEKKVNEGEEQWPEEVQLGGLGGLAVNRTGAGGVPAGTVYAATRGIKDGTRMVAMFEPEAGGGLKFVEGWEVTDETGEPPHGVPYEPCGPVAAKLPDGSEPGEHSACPSRPEAAGGYVDIGVDQASGNVYVFRDVIGFRGFNDIVEYSADGASEVTRFAQQDPSGKDIAETPQELHSFPAEPLTVGPAGTVYIADEYLQPGDVSKHYHRTMVFKPHNGDYADYEYAGEVAAEPKEAQMTRPEVDDAGNLYAIVAEQTVVEYGPEAPAAYPAPAASPICAFNFSVGGIRSMAVDPSSGEVFLSSYKEKETIHRLSPCAGGKFSEAGTFKFSPKRGGVGSSGLWAMAFDPLRETPGRPAGFLYAGSNDPVGGKAEGSYPEALTESALGYAFALPVELSPTIKEQTFAHVTTTTAVLGATINPKGSATHYAFQYETEAAYQANEPSDRFAGASEAPPGGASAGEGSEGIVRTAALSGLAPDTAYRFRTVASSHCSETEPEKLCETDSEALSLRTFPAEAPGLPDHRAYELVSPAEKHGGQVLAIDPRHGSCGECKPGFLFTQFPRQSTPDGDGVAYEGTAFDSEAAALSENEYVSRRDPHAGWQTTSLAPAQLSEGSNAGYKAFTASLERTILKQSEYAPALAAEAPPGFQSLYAQSGEDPLAIASLIASEPSHRPASEFQLEFAGASADLSRVFFTANDALTAETPFAPEASDGGPGKYNLYEWHEGQLALVNVLPDNAASQPEKHEDFAPPSSHPVSADGQIVYFPGESGQVYVREEGERTLEVLDPGHFLVASTDGSKVLLDDGCLYDLGEEQCEDLTQGKGGFEGVVGESEDLSHLYFVDTEVLSGAEENANKEVAVAGQNNLYAWAQGEGTRFVARLDARDDIVGRLNANGSEYSGDWFPPYERTAEASPNGRYLAFTSLRQLSGYGNIGPCHLIGENKFGPGPCPQAFLYDSVTGTLACASCNPSGEAPIGRATLPVIKSAQFLGQLPRYLSDEGRLFFDSADSILPADSNEGVEDVYQYEPAGLGTCQRPEGCISLISAGTGVTDSNFVAADPSGKNVFFTTRDQLTLRDRDELADLYDAREDGGLAIETEVARSECQGEACQPPVSAPNDPTPGSSTFEGAGNVREAKAKKHRHKKKRHAKHANKRAAKPNHGGVK